MKKIIRLYLLLIIAAVICSGCSYYSIDLKKNEFVNIHNLNKYRISDEWGIVMVSDEDVFNNYLDGFREISKTAEGYRLSKDEVAQKIKSFTFEKYRYALFYMSSDTPFQPVSKIYRVSVKDAKGHPVEITDTLFFTDRYQYDDKIFEYSWLMKFEKKFIPENYPKENLPLEFTIYDKNRPAAVMDVSF